MPSRHIITISIQVQKKSVITLIYCTWHNSHCSNLGVVKNVQATSSYSNLLYDGTVYLCFLTTYVFDLKPDVHIGCNRFCMYRKNRIYLYYIHSNHMYCMRLNYCAVLCLGTNQSLEKDSITYSIQVISINWLASSGRTSVLRWLDTWNRDILHHKYSWDPHENRRPLHLVHQECR